MSFDIQNVTSPNMSFDIPLKDANEWNQDGTLKILSIGNSFSINTLKFVSEIATAACAKSIYLGNLYMDRCKLYTQKTHVMMPLRTDITQILVTVGHLLKITK